MVVIFINIIIKYCKNFIYYSFFCLLIYLFTKVYGHKSFRIKSSFYKKFKKKEIVCNTEFVSLLDL